MLLPNQRLETDHCVVCGIASRFYEDRPDLYPQAMHYAQLAAGTALISGTKNVEMCAAYMLLSLYPVPAKKWEQQRSWLYLGLAIRFVVAIPLLAGAADSDLCQ